MNRRANIGDFVVSVTVFIGVIAIMAFFVLFSTGIFGANTVKGKIDAAAEGDLRADNMGLLFEQVNIDGRNMSVLESHLNASYAPDFEKVSAWGKFESELGKLVPVNGCLFLYSGVDSSISEGFALNNTNDVVTKANYPIGTILSTSSHMPITFVDSTGKETTIVYTSYRGECP